MFTYFVKRTEHLSSIKHSHQSKIDIEVYDGRIRKKEQLSVGLIYFKYSNFEIIQATI